MSTTCVWTTHCDLCGHWDGETTDSASMSRSIVQLQAGWERKRINGRLIDICHLCTTHPLAADKSNRVACGNLECSSCTGFPFSGRLRDGFVAIVAAATEAAHSTRRAEQ